MTSQGMSALIIAPPGRLRDSLRVLLRASGRIARVEETDDVHTLGGLVMAELGRRPAQGDAVRVGGVTLRVEAVERLAITRVSVHFPPNLSVR